MKDVFGRELMIGDLIICFPYKTGKNICIEKISGFSKKGYEINGGLHKLESECLILKREDGTKYFDDGGLPLNCWKTNYKDKIL
jgi:hypothetical protein